MHAFASERREGITDPYCESGVNACGTDAVAGRGPTDPSAIPSPTVDPRLPIPVGTSRCRSSQLEVAFGIDPPAAGNILVGFEMRNKSSRACWVYGFVGFQTLDGSGHALPQTLRWTTNSFFGKSDPLSRILLPAGTSSLGSPGTGHAFFSVATNDVLCDTNQDSVVSLEIWPPDESPPLIVPATAADGRSFSFCRYLELYPLQVEPNLTLSS